LQYASVSDADKSLMEKLGLDPAPVPSLDENLLALGLVTTLYSVVLGAIFVATVHGIRGISAAGRRGRTEAAR